MLNAITHSHVFVLDQDEALDFYVGKLGLEVAHRRGPRLHALADRQRPRRPGREILLERPGPPAHGRRPTAEQVRELRHQGRRGGVRSSSRTDDCRGDLRDAARQGRRVHRGADRAPYGIDCGLRDPFGNHIRIGQLAAARRVEGRGRRIRTDPSRSAGSAWLRLTATGRARARGQTDGRIDARSAPQRLRRPSWASRSWRWTMALGGSQAGQR